MNWHRRAYVSFLLGCLFVVLGSVARADLWNTGYFPGYRQDEELPTAALDYSALTHVIHFALLPNTNGTINRTGNVVSHSNTTNIVTQAHAAGKKVLISIIGGTNFFAATAPANVGKFTTDLVAFMRTNGYDGIDIDWEPLRASQTNQYASFITGLRAQLDTITPRPLLTAAVALQPRIFGALHDKFDQINIMTYGMSGTWDGWVTWHASPMFNGGHRFPSTGGLLPSIDGDVNEFINAGVPPKKLGFGIGFYGQRWTGGTGTSTGGATEPRQSWSTEPSISSLSFNSIMTTYYQTNRYRWDTNAQSPYLSINNTGSTNDMFISYDDERSCQSKVSYARNKGLGGVMIWELSQGYRPSQPSGQRHPLLQAIKTALATPWIVSIERTNQHVDLSFSSAPLGRYRVLWSTDPGSTNWTTLTTNLVGTGEELHVIHTNALSQPQRFYRIQTPP